MARVMGSLRHCLYHRRALGTTLIMDHLLLTDSKAGMCRFVVVAVKSRDLQDEVEEAHSFWAMRYHKEKSTRRIKLGT